MKVILIEPPFHRFMGFYRYFFPPGLSALSAFLKKEGHEVLIYDADHGDKPEPNTSSGLLKIYPRYLEGIKDSRHPIWSEIKSTLANCRPDIIGITFMSTKIGAVRRIVEIAKSLFPEVPVVLGGVHPSVLYRSSLEQTKADIAVVGEGEVTFSELLKELENPNPDIQKIQGIAFKSPDGKIVVTPPRPLIRDLDSLPFPDRESLLNLESYRPDDLSMIMTSRGCPYNCTFCSSIWERRVRTRSIPHLLNEIRYLQDRFQAQNIYFKDDTFTVDKKRVYTFCKELDVNNIKIQWECLTRIELIEEELLKTMQRSGLFNLKIGIETGSPRLLKETNKNISIEQIKKGAALLKKLNMKWSAFFMIGYPDETEEEIALTRQFIEQIQPTYVSMSVLVPYPGCKYYYDLKKTGKISEHTDWNLYDPFSLETHFSQKIDQVKFREIAIDTMKYVDEYNSRHKNYV
ncbi:MAG: B12-binding domain-containing radical SAM protein [Candidatus Aminicenantes bacterium]|nr:B12-binding domain-containing radical SAM protein [Candidatus Aminicenantes bacterium]